MKRLFAPLLFLLFSCVSLIPAHAQEITIYLDVDTDASSVVWNQGYLEYQPTDGCGICQNGEFLYTGTVMLYDPWGNENSCSWGPIYMPANQTTFNYCDAWLPIVTTDLSPTQGYSGQAFMNVYCTQNGFFLAQVAAATPFLSFGKSSYVETYCFESPTGAGAVINYSPFGTNCPGKCTQPLITTLASSCPSTYYLQCTDTIISGKCTGFYLCSDIPTAGFCK